MNESLLCSIFCPILSILVLNFASLLDTKCYLSVLNVEVTCILCEVEPQIYGLCG